MVIRQKKIWGGRFDFCQKLLLFLKASLCLKCFIFILFSSFQSVTAETAQTCCYVRVRGSQARSRGEWEVGGVMRALGREHLHNLRLNGLLGCEGTYGRRMIE